MAQISMSRKEIRRVVSLLGDGDAALVGKLMRGLETGAPRLIDEFLKYNTPDDVNREVDAEWVTPRAKCVFGYGELLITPERGREQRWHYSNARGFGELVCG